MSRTRLTCAALAVGLTTGLAAAFPVASSTGAAADGRRGSIIGVSASTHDALNGDTLTFSGRVEPRVQRTVRLQLQVGGRWRTLEREKTDQDGAYSFTLPAMKVGRNRFRTLAPATRRLRKDASRVEVVRVTGLGKTAWHGDLYPHRTYRWNPCEGSITYAVNPRRAPEGWQHDVHGAVQRISVQSGYRFRYVGKTRFVPQRGKRQRGADIVIAFVRRRESTHLSQSDPDFNAVGGAHGFYRRGSKRGELVDGFVVANAKLYNVWPGGFAEPEDPDTATRGLIMMHELGHVLGLAHVENKDSRLSQVMHPSAHGIAGAWGAGDARGLVVQGAAKGCIDVVRDRPATRSAADLDVTLIALP